MLRIKGNEEFISCVEKQCAVNYWLDQSASQKSRIRKSCKDMNQPSGGSVGKPEKQPRPSTAKSNDADKAPQSMPISSDDRVQPVLWPTLLSIGFSQLMVAIPVLWMLIDAVEHPKPLAFYIAALLLPPAESPGPFFYSLSSDCTRPGESISLRSSCCLFC